MNIEKARDLLQRYQAGLCTDAERRVVEQWLDSIKHEEPENWMGDTERFGEALRQRIDAVIAADDAFIHKPKRRFGWLRVAAAILLLTAATFMYYYFSNNHTDKNSVAKTSETIAPQEIVPGSQGAILTLGDGTQIVLDSAAEGNIASQSNVAIRQQNGELIYADGKAPSPEPVYNTVTTPRGRQFRLKLSDGTAVWLNAGSSIRYPASFSDTARSVEISGEAYLEVASMHSSDGRQKIPFRVQIMQGATTTGIIEVTGTAFNVNAYPDEAITRTTLVEGGVILKTAGQVRAIKPGQQVRYNMDGMLKVLSNINIATETAWKNGFFYCDQTTDMQMIMRQLARWYDIEVTYQDGKVPGEKYWGEIPREASLQTALKVLEMSGVQFRIEGRKVIVGAR